MQLLQLHKDFWNKSRAVSLMAAVLWFVFALTVQHFAYAYIDNRAQVTAVGDLFLDHLPTLDLDFFIIQGALIATFAVIIVLVSHPKYITFSLKTLALFIIIRSFFISLTHLGGGLHQLQLSTDGVGFSLYDFLYNAKNDFFFSGHVGAAFLFMLLFFRLTWAKYFFGATAVIFAISMLFAHMHYSIDLFAAPFITFSIFCIAKRLFPFDYKLTSWEDRV